jgi:hypothetical protein
MGVTFHGITPHEGSSVRRNHLTDGRGLGLVRPIYLECLKNSNITFRWNIEVTSLLSAHAAVHGIYGRKPSHQSAQSIVRRRALTRTGAASTKSCPSTRATCCD